jgi:hypothetical protein
MRKKADMIRQGEHYIVPLVFYEERLVLEMIDERAVWCDANCLGSYGPDLTQDEGFVMVFTDSRDAINFKLRWY